MNGKKKKLGILVTIIVICLSVIMIYFYFSKMSSYYDVIRAYNQDIETKGRSIIKTREFDLSNQKNKNDEDKIQLKYLNELNIDSIEGEIIDVDIKHKINDIEIKADKMLYIKEVNELHFGIKIKNNKKIDISNIEFWLRNESSETNDFITTRTLYRTKGIWSTFERCWFKGIDLESFEKLFLVIRSEEEELQVLIYENK